MPPNRDVLLHQPKRRPYQHATDKTAALPLGYAAAVARAIELRERGHWWTWAAIADVMATYHGFHRGAAWWRMELQGRVTSRARGGSFTEGNERQAA